MTEKEFHRRFNSLISDIVPFLKGFAREALKSGCVDLATAPDNYALPKNVLTAGLLRLGGHGPQQGQRAHKKEVANIRANVPLLFSYTTPLKPKCPKPKKSRKS